MLSSVLRGRRAVQVNIEIMRAFVRFRQMMQANVDLARKLATLERKYDAEFKVVFDAIRELMTPPEKTKNRIGFEIAGTLSTGLVEPRDASPGSGRPGKSVHRADLGDALAVLTDRLGDSSALAIALPALDIDRAMPLADRPRSDRFAPFARDARVGVLTTSDVRKLSGEPAPPRVLVPVTVEG